MALRQVLHNPTHVRHVEVDGYMPLGQVDTHLLS